MYSPATGLSYEKPEPKHFSFNSPFGACPVCHGLGQKLVFDPNLIAPDKQKSLDQGAILPWRRGGKRMIVYYKALLRGLSEHYKQSLEVPYSKLPDTFKQILLYGSGETEIPFAFFPCGQAFERQSPVRRGDSEFGTAVRGEWKASSLAIGSKAL
jgi:excinuclease ABC subunit A